MISVSHMTALDAEPELLVETAARAGFDGVGLRIFPPPHAPDQYPVVGDRRRIRDLKQRASDAGIRLFEAESFGMDGQPDRDAYARALEVAAELGAGVVVSAGIDDNAERLAGNYHWLASVAADHGILVAMEFMPYRGMKTFRDALAMHAAVDHPNAKLLIDAVHLSRGGSTVADVAGMPDRSIIGHFHLCDAPAAAPARLEDVMAESRVGRLYPGQGELQLSQLLQLLPQECSLSLEAPHRDQQSWSPAERILSAGETTLDWLRRNRKH